MTPEKVKVLVGSGQALVRAGYRALLQIDERLDVVGEATSGHHLVALAARTAPGVVLVDLALPGLEQRDGVRRVVSHPFIVESAVLLMTPTTNDPRVPTALRAGAAGVLTEDSGPATLRRAVRMLADGQAVLPYPVLDDLIGELPPRGVDREAAATRLEELTEREREVVALVGRGLSNEQIAQHLVITPATAKTHVYRAMTKLGARHRAQLVVIAYETGLVLPPIHADPAGIRLLSGA
jgi:DNA-binding NarL/FixJ family response regulator